MRAYGSWLFFQNFGLAQEKHRFVQQLWQSLHMWGGISVVAITWFMLMKSTNKTSLSLFCRFRGKVLKIQLPWDEKMRAILPLAWSNFSFSQASCGRSSLRISRLRRKRSYSTGMSSAYVNFLMWLSWLHHSKSWQESNESASHISVQR